MAISNVVDLLIYTIIDARNITGRALANADPVTTFASYYCNVLLSSSYRYIVTILT